MRILVIDDYPDAAETLSKVLATDGHEVRVAHSPKEAGQALVAAFVPDALIVDLALPDVDGYRLTRELCEAIPRKPLLIAVTGHPNLDNRSAHEGFQHHFLKPVDGVRLLEVLRANGSNT